MGHFARGRVHPKEPLSLQPMAGACLRLPFSSSFQGQLKGNNVKWCVPLFLVGVGFGEQKKNVSS